MQVAEVTKSSEKRAIVILSAGTRPWLDGVLKTFDYYAAECGASVHVERELPSKEEFPFPDMPDRPGRANKLAYACKTYFAWKYLAEYGYDRVLFVDDTCCVKANTPNIFDLVPFGHLGYVVTGASHAEISFAEIAEYIKTRSLPEIEYNFEDYMNSGVLVYDRTMTEALSKERVCAAASLMVSALPHQTLTYYLIKSANIPMFSLPKAFNTVPAVGLPRPVRKEMTDIREYIRDNIYIYHVTGVYNHRDVLISQITERFISEWEEFLSEREKTSA